MSDPLPRQQDSAAWSAARDAILPLVHEVDRDATRIWFQFFPLALADAIATSGDLGALTRALRIEGVCALTPQRDTSHWFLYGHRYWPKVHAAIAAWAEEQAEAPNVDLPSLVRRFAGEVARAAEAEQSLLLGITLVGLMTLRQLGPVSFQAGDIQAPSSLPTTKSPAQIVAERKRDDGQGLLGFLRGPKTRYTVRFDERRPDATFALIHRQDLTTAAANDTRDYLAGYRASREGPIPTQCRSASCGTCWVGILGGAEKLSDVDDLESRRLREFGYLATVEQKPVVRLACMAKASGNVTLVIPSWNGIIGKAGLVTP